ncbi:hypothetical protein Tco_0646658 [Tanacetum coccineum]
MGWAYEFHQDKASSVKVPVANVTMSSSAHLLRENTDSVRSNQRMRSSVGRCSYWINRLAIDAAYALELRKCHLISVGGQLKIWPRVSDVDDHKGAKYCCQVDLREKRYGARHMEKLGPDVGGLENELYKLVCKVEEDEGHIGVFGVRG